MNSFLSLIYESVVHFDKACQRIGFKAKYVNTIQIKAFDVDFNLILMLGREAAFWAA